MKRSNDLVTRFENLTGLEMESLGSRSTSEITFSLVLKIVQEL